MYFDEFIQRLRRPDLPPFILLAGDAEDVQAEALRQLRTAFLAKGAPGRVTVLDAAECDLPSLFDQARAGDLFAARQLIVYRRAEKRLGGKVSEADLGLLVEYLAAFNEQTVLVLCAKSARKDSRLAKLADKGGWFVSCNEMPSWKAGAWVKSLAAEKGLKLSEESAQVLIQKVGPDMGLLRSTLEYLAVTLLPSREAGLRDVERLIVPGAEPEVFAFIDAVAARKTQDALRWLAEVERARPASEDGLVSMLYARLKDLLWLACLREQGVSEAEASRHVPMHPFRLKNLWQQAKAFIPPELERGLRQVARLQAGQVTGRFSKTGVVRGLERWILQWGRTVS